MVPRKVVLVLGLLLAVSVPAYAATVRVPADQPTIQAGIDAAADGDTVLVAPGTYHETLHEGFMGKGLVVRSAAGPISTTIASYENEVVTFSRGEGPAAELDGFTLREGDASGLVIFNASVQIKNCIIRDCSSASRYYAVAGGGVAILGGAPVFTDCVIAHNQVVFYGEPPGYEANGGGMYCGGGTPTLIRCTFIGNEARGAYIQGDYYGGSGGAIYGGGFTLINCTLYGNTARFEGGGLFVTGGAVIRNTVVAFSAAGGAVACWNSEAPVLSCCDLFGNTGGDWIACVAGDLGIDGNISADPLFCDAANGDFTLNAQSPCAPANSPAGCGLIGALPVGCGVTDAAAGDAPLVELHLSVTPNPMRGGAEFAFPGVGPRVLAIFDSQGRLVDRLTGIDGRWVWQPGSSSPAGVYFARVEGGAVGEAVKFLRLR